MELRYKLWCSECQNWATGMIKNKALAEQALEASDHLHAKSLKIVAYNTVVSATEKK